MSVRAIRGRWLGALLLAGACAGPPIDRRFDQFGERMAQLSAQVEECERQAVSIRDQSRREAKLQQWEAVMQVIILARAAGAIAYFNEDARALERIEKQVEGVVAQCPELADERSAANGSRN
jgi:hypothetical protein